MLTVGAHTDTSTDRRTPTKVKITLRTILTVIRYNVHTQNTTITYIRYRQSLQIDLRGSTRSAA